MSSIEELQQRVVEAEERFGLINAERAKYSERLMGLIDAIETRLRDQQAEIESQATAAASQAEELEVLRQDSAENKLLRGMLQSLLNAIELGNSDALGQAMQVMDAKISALIAGSSTPVAAPEEVSTPEEPEVGSDDAVAPEAEPLEMEAAETEVSAAEPAEAQAPEDEVSDTVTIEAEAPEVETADAAGLEEGGPDPLEEEGAAPELEAAETDEIIEAVDEAAVPEPEVAVPEPEVAAEAIADAPDDAEDTTADGSQEIEASAGVVDEPEEVLTALASDAAEDIQAAPTPAPEPELEAETAAPEIMDIPVSDANVTMIDEEMVIGDGGDEALEAIPLAADAAMENLVDEDDAVLSVPVVADGGEQKPEASSLEDIMRRVSKLVEEEGALGPLAAGGVQIGVGAEGAEAQASEPAAAQESATGG